MLSDEEIDRIASRVAEKLKGKIGTVALRAGELPTPCNTPSKYTCDASSFTCQASLFSCSDDFECSNSFTGFTKKLMR